MLECDGTFPRKGKVSDLTPLWGMRLKRLSLLSTRVADLSPLEGLPLTFLNCGEARVSDLSPLKGMKLELLTLQSTGVKDLAPLRGMPLKWLDVAEARGISDLSPLRDMPLEYLNLTSLPVSDLSAPQHPGQGPFPAQGTAPQASAARLSCRPRGVRAIIQGAGSDQRQARSRLLEGSGRQVAPIRAAHAASLRAE
jgi:hypothetical protein